MKSFPSPVGIVDTDMSSIDEQLACLDGGCVNGGATGAICPVNGGASIVGNPSGRSPRMPMLAALSILRPSAGLRTLPTPELKLPAEDGNPPIDEAKLAGEGNAE